MKWSPQQDAALMGVSKWFNDPNRKQVYRVFGYAGTGKTSLAKHFVESVDGDVLYGAYTGKAALVMRKNGCHNATTIHSMIYTAHIDKKTGEVSFSYNNASIASICNLIVIDECSMVDDAMAQDLLSFGKPILVLGDPMQLPPINGAGYFTNATPDHMLTEIHRQANENPIIYLASKAREGKYIKEGVYGNSLVTNKFLKDDILAADQVLCGKNDTRTTLNGNIRRALKYTDIYPMVGEKLLCTRNKTKKNGERLFFNGGMYGVDSVINKSNFQNNFKIDVTSIDDDTKMKNIKVFKHLFDPYNFMKPDWKILSGGVEFDFGYAITTHRSQGSQWENVYIVDEKHVFNDFSHRWLYTAITRASERLILFTG